MKKPRTFKQYLMVCISIVMIFLLGIMLFPEAVGKIIAIVIVFAIAIGVPYLLLAYLEKKRNQKARNKKARGQGFKNAEEKDTFINDIVEGPQPKLDPYREINCWRCGGSNGRIQRDRLAFHICLWVGMFVFGIGLLILPFLPKRVYCTACGARFGKV